MSEANLPTEEPARDEEFVPEDDRIIGQAFRWSLLAFALLGGLGAGIFFFTRQGKSAEVVIEKEIGKIEDLVADEAVLPTIRFTDCTAEAGITFRHFAGATAEKLLPETMGGGAAFFDADGDGDQDLLLVNSAPWSHAAHEGAPPISALYENAGDGRFRDITAGSGLDQSFYGMGVAVGDIDNDGDPDLFFSAVGKNRLFLNDGGTFRDVSHAAGVEGGDQEWSTSAGFCDYDGDGLLDLFVCNYVRWSRDIDAQINYSLNGKDRAYGPPTNYQGTFPYLYRNRGDGTFEDTSEAAGVRVKNPVTGDPMAKSLGVTFVDLDDDGHIDILVANDTVQNFLFHNLGDGTFEELGGYCGIGFDSNGKATGAMGIDAARYRNDGSLGIGIGNFANEMSSLYVSQSEALLFSDEAIGEGIGSPSRQALSFGLFFFDYDLDGRIDLLQSNGHLEETIHEIQSSQQYRQPPQLFWNAGPERRSCFMEVPSGSAGDFDRPIVGRAASYADIDADGDLDVLFTQVNSHPVLLRNEQSEGNHWLRCRLVGSRCNRDAIGARVELKVGGETLHRQVMPTRSYLTQVELPVTFGLGKSRQCELTVRWPDGSSQAVSVPSVDREIVIQQQP